MVPRAIRPRIWYEYPGQGAIRLGYRAFLLVNASVDAIRKLVRFGDTQQWAQGWLINRIDLLDLAASRRDLEKKFWPPRDRRWDFNALIAIKARDRNTMRRALPIVLRKLGIADPTAYVLVPGLDIYSPNW